MKWHQWVVMALMLLATVQGAFAVNIQDVQAYWSFNENLTFDDSGNGYELAPVGNPVWGIGKIENGSVFDAKSRLTNDVNWLPAEFTAIAWVKPTGVTGDQTIYVEGTSSFADARATGMELSGANVKCWSGDDSVAGGTVTVGVWNFVGCSRDAGGTLRAFINGTEVASGAAAAPFAGGEGLLIGTYRGAASQPQHNFTGSIDELGLFNRTFNSTDWSDYYNGGSGVSPQFIHILEVPVWVAPTPNDGATNNTQVTLNVSSNATGVRYFIWFDTNPNPTTLVVNNATTGNYSTSVGSSTQTYYYKAKVWNASLNYSANTTVRNWTYDAVNPAIVLNPSNEWNARNYSMRSPYDELVHLNITFTDDNDLFGMSINITRGNTSYFNITNETLSGLSYTYTRALNASTWPEGRYNVSLFVSDSHTAREIPDYQVTRKKSSVTFKPGNDNNIKIETRESSTITTSKELDRYTFRMVFDDATTKARTFDVKTDLCPLSYQSKSPYKGHFVSSCGRGGNWIDFEGAAGKPTVERIDDYHYTVTFESLPPDVTFKSIGGLNVLSANYSFYLGNLSANRPNPVFTSEAYAYLLNLTRDTSIQSVHVHLFYNGTEYEPSYVNSSGLYQVSRTVSAPNASMASHPFTWEVTTTQGDGNTSVYNFTQSQTVTSWEVIACGSPAFINWTQYDEDTPSEKLTGTFAVEIEYWVGNVSNAKLYNASFSSANSWRVCFTPATASFNANIYGQNKVSGSFTHRFYVQNGTYTNTTTLYSIYNANSSNDALYSNMVITAREESTYSYFPDVFAQLQRRYVGEGVWRTVQYDKSGDFGIIFFDVIEETVDYRIRYLDENNTLLQQTDSLKFICTSGVCELTQLLTPAGSGVTTPDITTSWTYNNATNIITIEWENNEGTSSTADIKVFKQNPSGTVTVCSTTQTGTAGSFDCNATGYTGELFVSIDVDDEPNAGGYVQIARTRIGNYMSGPTQALTTFLLMLTIIGFGLFSPIALVIMTVLSLVVVFFIGIFTPLTATFLIIAAVLGFAISIRVKQ